MGLAERVATTTTAAVLGTAILVGGGLAAWLTWRDGAWPVGVLGVVAAMSVVALGLAHLVARTTTIRPLRRVREVARQMRRLAEHGDVAERLPELEDDDVRDLTQAVNALLARLEDDAARLGARAARGEAAVEASSDGVLVTDAEGLVTYVNPALRSLVPLRGDPVGRRPIESVPIAEVQELVDRTLREDRREQVRVTSRTSDLVIRPLRVPGAGVLLYVQDVTSVRQAERARTDFVANVSHELRTPIASIMGYAETLLDDADRLEPDLRPLVQAVARNARRLRDLFEDLLELSRIEARRGDLPIARQRLRPLLDEAVVTAADLAAQRGQELSLECPDDLEGLVNREAVVTMVANLATNACNYTPEGGHVQVRAVADGPRVRIEVRDDGIGIDKVHHERIFERFYRVDEGRSRRLGGTGLGLAIVKHLALASRCRITVTSALGQGSTFSLHLPEEVVSRQPLVTEVR